VIRFPLKPLSGNWFTKMESVNLTSWLKSFSFVAVCQFICVFVCVSCTVLNLTVLGSFSTV